MHVLEISITRCAARIPPPQRHQRKRQINGLILTFLGMILCGVRVWAGGGCRTRPADTVVAQMQRVQSVEFFQRSTVSAFFLLLPVCSRFRGVPRVHMPALTSCHVSQHRSKSDTWNQSHRAETRKTERSMDRPAGQDVLILFSGSTHHLERRLQQRNVK